MMKQLALIALPVLFLSGCAVEEIAQTAADSAACQAMKGTISGLQAAYEAGLVDSGVLEQVDEIAGDQLEALYPPDSQLIFAHCEISLRQPILRSLRASRLLPSPIP
jgi:hypothetical protein